jgi:hypothetical protein
MPFLHRRTAVTPVNAVAAAVTAVLTCALVSACTSTVGGSGEARQPSTTAVTSTAASSSSAPTTTAPPTSASPTTTAPAAAPAPPECPNAACQISATVGLNGPYTFLLRIGGATSDYPVSSVVELAYGSVPVFWYVAGGDTPSHITCQVGTGTGNCVVVDTAGAHGSNATVWAFTGTTLKKGGTVTVATPETFARDLNGDRFVDVEGLQDTYTPTYATGKVYWQTWTSNGTTLTSTGCTAPTTTAAPRPTAPVTGHCG